MTTADPLIREPLEAQFSPRLFQAADLAVLPDQLPSGPVKYELDHGRLILASVEGCEHGHAQAFFAGRLGNWVQASGCGGVWIGTGVILSRNPDCVYGPDVLFVAAKSLPAKESKEGYLETIPELVVEIRSKNDTRAYLERKVQDYLKAGVVQVWVAEPESGSVTIYTVDAEPRIFGRNDTLTAGDLIPGFSLPLAEVFEA